jgi:hypothetical protein
MSLIYRSLWNLREAWRLLQEGERLIQEVEAKKPSRTEILNALVSHRGYRSYLEIGVRNPADNFDLIDCAVKRSVDPGLEFRQNPVDFVMTSDQFFDHWASKGGGEGFDLIFIDGWHRADQCWRDVCNALRFLNPGGAVVVHDVLPPAKRFAREEFHRDLQANTLWNGTTWKAFHRYQWEGTFDSRIVDSDWGVGIIDTAQRRTPTVHGNPFYEWDVFRSFVKESGRVADWKEVWGWFQGASGS